MGERPEPRRSTEPRVDALGEFVARVGPGYHDITAPQDAAAAEVLAALDEAGVDAVLLKGRGLGALLYGAGEQRRYSDVDLLVAPHELDAAEGVLQRLSYANADTVRGIDDVGGVVHEQTWMRTTPDSAGQPVIDLHWSLPGARVAPALQWQALAARRARIDVGGRRAAVLDRAGQAMHLAMHAAQHGPGFQKNLDELALALERWPGDVWESAAALAQEIEATSTFAAGLRLLPQGGALASRLALPSTTELDWTIRHRHNRPRGTFHLQALAETESLGGRLRIVRRSLLPRQTWIEYQHPWARGGALRLAAGYGLHLMRAPFWGARALLFRRRAKRAARPRRTRGG
jgi:hypothetical protein